MTRKFGLKVFAAILPAALLLTACSGQAPEGESESEGGDVVVYGSLSMQSILEGTVSDRVAEHDITITHSPLLGSEAFTKTLAQRNNPEAGVVVVDMSLFQQGVEADLWEDIDPDILTNAKDLSKVAQPAAFDNKGIGVYAQTFGIQYRKDILEDEGIAPPTKLEDLQNPKLAGHVGLTSTSSGVGVWQLIEFARLGGGDENNIKPGLEFAKNLVSSGQVGYIARSASDINQAMERGEIWAAIQYDQGAFNFIKGNPDVGFVYPDGGVPIEVNVAAIPKNAKNPRAAQRVLNELVSADSQNEVANVVMAVPTRAELPRAAVKLGVTEAKTGRVSVTEMEAALGSKAHYIDWTVAAPQRAEWHRLWQEQVEAQ